MSDPVEEIISIRFAGLQDAPKLFDDAVAGVKKLDAAIAALQKNQSSLEKQFQGASPTQQASITKQLNTTAYQLDQAVNDRTDAAKIAEEQYQRKRQYDDLARQVRELQRQQAHTPPAPGPAENLSPAMAQEYEGKVSDLHEAQGKMKRARTDNSKAKWAQQVDNLQSEIEGMAADVTRVAYKKPLEEVRRRLKATETATGRAATNAEFQSIERDVAHGQVMGLEESPEIAQRRREAMNPLRERMRKMFSPSHMLANMTEMGGINTGYALAQLGEGYSQYAAQTMTGNRVTPEAQQRALYGLLPGVGALAGSAFGWAGSLVGGGVGSAAQGFLSAGSERTEHVRIASEQMSLAMGKGISAAHGFANAIESVSRRLGTPAAELAQTVSSLSLSVTGMTAGGIGLQGQLQKSLGDNYTWAAGGQASFMQQPFTDSYRKLIATGQGDAGKVFSDAAFRMAFAGDEEGYKKQLALSNTAKTPPVVKGFEAAQNKATAPVSGHTLGLELLANILMHGPGGVHHPLSSVQDAQAAKARADALKATHPEAIAATGKQRQSDADYLASVLEKARTGRETSLYGMALASVPATRADAALAAGKGLAGIQGYDAQQVQALTIARAGLDSQLEIVRARLATAGLTPDQRRSAQYTQAVLGGQLAGLQSQMQAVGITEFRQRTSESDATFGGQFSRLGMASTRLLLTGASAFDASVGSNYAQQERMLRGRASYDLALANDTHNFLTPGERQQRRTQAVQERLEALSKQNEMATRRVQETQEQGGLRQSGIALTLARAQAGGGTSDIYGSQGAQADEMARQQEELKARIAEGNLTLSQRTAIQTQINTLAAAEVRLRQQARQEAYQMIGAEQSAAASSAGSIARRLVFAGGTSDASYGAGAVSLSAERARVATLKAAADDPSLPPSTRQARIAAYNEAAAKLDTDVVGQVGTYTNDPNDMRRRQALEGMDRRMNLSPFVPGNRLGVAARLITMDKADITGVDAQIKRVQSDPSLTDSQKQQALLKLEGQREGFVTAMTERSANVAEQMFSNRINMSVGSMSFASRIMPSDADVARLAEARGLGPMSARVFGFTRRQTYRDTSTYGLLAPDQNLVAFGKRPGDFNSADGGKVAFGNGMGQVLGDGNTPAMATALTELTTAITTLTTSGFKLQIETKDISTGQSVTKTVNAIKNHDSHAIQRGGGSPRSQHRY